MKTKKILVASLIVSVIMFLNISLLEKGNANLSLNLSSLQKAMADGETQCGLACYGKRTFITGYTETEERFENGCSFQWSVLWENPTTCCGIE